MDEETLRKKRKKAQKDGNLQVLIDVQNKLGGLYFGEKQHEKALEAYRGQLQASESLGNKLQSAVSHRMIGEVYADMESFKEALEHLNLYLEIAKDIDNPVEEQRAYATLGRTYYLLAESESKEPDTRIRIEALKDSKKAYKKSIVVAEKLEDKIDKNELITMKARLLHNLGLVLEQQKDIENALKLVNQAAKLCRNHNLHEDLHRANLVLAGLNDKLGNIELAIQHFDNAAKYNEPSARSEARLSKAELLLRLGEWMDAQKILKKLYKSKLSDHSKLQVTRLLRIAVVLCRTEDELLTETNLTQKEKLYENMGDAAVEVRALDKAIEFYSNMVSCAELSKSNKLGPALNSLAQTLRDVGKFQEAIPHARRELQLCTEPKDTYISALFLAKLLVNANEPDEEIREMFEKSLTSAKQCDDPGFQRQVLSEYLEYLQKKEDVDLDEIERINRRIDELPESQVIESESEVESPEIGADICLEELTDLEEEEVANISKARKINVARRNRCIVKKNEKGETQLHVACIRGETSRVERLLEENHPTLVRDHAGWTPLHEASNHGFVEIVQMLIRAGADVNDPGGVNCDGVTPLHDAAANGHSAIIQLLLENGADPNLLTKSGETALDSLESWRKRVNLTPVEERDYELMRKRLAQVTTTKGKKKKRKSDERPSDRKREALLYGNESEPIVADDWVSPEKISAGEDYKRTIAAMQHPGRQNLPKKQSGLPKITAPLIDSEELLVDDWIEDDIGNATKKKETFFSNSGIPPVMSTKRKPKDDSREEIDSDLDKSMKRQKVSPSLTKLQKFSPMEIEELSPIHLDEHSRESSSSNELTIERFEELEKWPKKRKVRQINLFKQGFTKKLRVPSPSSSPSPEPIIEPATIIRTHSIQSRHSRDSDFISETIDLEILVDSESFELKLHFRDLSKTMSHIEDLIRDKFESKTGCKPTIRFKTIDGIILPSEMSLEEVSRDTNKLKLLGEIMTNNLPPIVDRFKKVCEYMSVDVSDLTLKSLRICDNTSTFRLQRETRDEELEPICRCLHYQQNLQVLSFSNTSMFFNGKLLNNAISFLPNLAELHLQCCDIDANCLSQIDKLPLQLRELDLSYNPLGNRSQKKLFDLLEPLKRLQSLNLRSCRLDDFRFSLDCGTLVNLDISWNPIGGDGAANLLQRQLLSLNLTNTQNFSLNRGNVIDKIFFNKFPDFSFSTLETLELSCCQATDLDIDQILSRTPNLMKITLSNNVNVTKTSLCALLSRKPTMSYIDLSGCRLIDEVPEPHLRIVSPQTCSVLVHVQFDIIDAWEALWQGRGYAKKLPQSLVWFKPR